MNPTEVRLTSPAPESLPQWRHRTPLSSLGMPKRRYDRGTFPADRDRTPSNTISFLDR
jgi:hypothetical protein